MNQSSLGISDTQEVVEVVVEGHVVERDVEVVVGDVGDLVHLRIVVAAGG